MAEPRSIAWVGYFDASPWRTDESRMCDALERLGVRVIRVDLPWHDLSDVASDGTIDWLIFSKCRELAGRPIMDIARIAKPRMAQVLFDLMDYQERLIQGFPWPTASRTRWWIPMARHFEVVFLKEQGNFARYAELGVNCVYLDQGAEIAEFPPVQRPSHQFDLAFIGRWTRQRQEMISALARSLDVVVYTSTPQKWRTPSATISPAVFGSSFAEAVASATVSWGESATHDVAGYWSDRCYRIMASAGCFLTRFTPGIDRTFRNYHDLVWYSSVDEALEVAQYLAENQSLATEIGVNARQAIVQHHTYDHRATELLANLSSI